MVTFEKAPLVEAIIELRWDFAAPMVSVPVGAQPPLFVADGKHEALFAELASQLAEMGFERSERLVPAGLVVPPNQPIIRYRGKDASPLFQAGLGIFSMNINPPYRSWEDLHPMIEKALEILFAAREKCGLGVITKLLLRYVNHFNSTLIDDHNAAWFSRDIAGIKIEFPAAIQRKVRASESVTLNLAFGFKLDWGGSLQIQTADAVVNGKSGVILDTTVAADRRPWMKPSDVFETLDRAHTEIRSTFLEMTKRLYDAMLPMER